jgi:hypothetical protein
MLAIVPLGNTPARYRTTIAFSQNAWQAVVADPVSAKDAMKFPRGSSVSATTGPFAVLL